MDASESTYAAFLASATATAAMWLEARTSLQHAIAQTNML